MTDPRDFARDGVTGLMPAVAPLAVQVKEPMGVVWQGVEYRVAAWNVHGFVFEKPIPRILTPGHGRVADFTLLVGPRGTRIEMQVQACAEDSGDEQPLAFRFVDLQRAQSEVLHRLVDHAVNKQALSLTRLLNEISETRQHRQDTVQRTQETRKWLQLSLAGLVLALASSWAWTRFTTVPARYAAVSAVASVVAPAAAGLVGAIPVSVGQRVMPGDIIAHVRSADHDRRVQSTISERMALEAEQAELTARRGAITQLSVLAGTGNEAERLRLDSALAIAERRLAVERQQLAALHASGLPTARRQSERAQQQARVLAAEQDVLGARRGLDGLAQSAALAQVGVLPGLGGAATGTTDATDLRIAQLEERLAQARLQEVQARDGEPILATCDCTIVRIDRRVGELTDASRPLAVLAEGGMPTIHALILGEHARSVRTGDRATINLANGTRLTGRVSRLDYAAHWSGYAGLQDNVFAADRFARVEIVPDQPIDAPVGMTASVTLSTDRFLAPLRQFLGL